MFNDFKVANYPASLVSPELHARLLSRLYTGDIVDGFTVTPGTGLQVVLAPGNALVRYGSSAVASAREVSLVANFNLTIGTADVSNPRNDLVVLYVDNGVTLPGGVPTSANLDGPGVAKAKIVPGTAAASPVDPNSTAIQASVGAGNPYTIIARVRVDAGVSVIAGNKVTDLRTMAKTTAGKIDFTTFDATLVQSGANETTTSTAFQDTAIVVTGNFTTTRVRITITALLYNTAAADTIIGVSISGATTSAADDQSVHTGTAGSKFSSTQIRTITPGSNTFRIRKRVSGGTGNLLSPSIIVEPIYN